MRGDKVRPTLRSVIGRGHLILALLAVTLASVSLTLLGVLALRVYAEHNLHLIARSINYTVEAAVVFNDSAAATEALSLIASTEEVANAEVFDANGKLLAQWIRPDTGMLSRVELELAHTLLEQPISQPILHQGRVIGSTHLTGHGGSLLRFLLSGLAGILICTALSAWIALHLARRLLRGITGPLQSLAEMEAWQSHLQSENESLAHQANHDSLTGLPNRAFFEGRLIRALRSAAKVKEQVAVLYLDSDRFKEINDSFGHAAGDAVLVAVAERVRAQLREDDLVARLGGDEFAILLAPLHKVEDARRIADKIIASMDLPIPVPGNTQVLTSLSIGIAIYPDHGATPGALLNAADAAMYQAKRLSSGGQQTAESEHSAANVHHRS